MSLVTLHDEIYQAQRRRFPAWLLRSLATAFSPQTNPIYGDGTLFGEAAYLTPGDLREEVHAKDPVIGSLTLGAAAATQTIQWLLAQTSLSLAEGDFLDLHGRDRGQPRRSQEHDDDYRARLRGLPEVATEQALEQAAGAVVPGTVVFTLRSRQLAWGRHHWGTNRRWGVTVIPVSRRGAARTVVWGNGRWGTTAWSSLGFRGPVPQFSPWLVSVALAPRLPSPVAYYWRRAHWSRFAWASPTADHPAYKALRQALEERRAAGTTILIWIDEGT